MFAYFANVGSLRLSICSGWPTKPFFRLSRERILGTELLHFPAQHTNRRCGQCVLDALPSALL